MIDRMNFKRAAALALLAVASCASPPAKPAGRLDWWREAKYGMFIHWGVYSVPAGEYKGKLYGGASEWLMNTAHIPIAEYEKFPPHFNPVKFDAKAWAKLAKDAGMKYVVITSKHHDGFAMWDTRVNDWSLTKRTPFKRQPLKELADACRAEGLKFGLYYSILDWHVPSQKGAGKAEYVKGMKAQLRELVDQCDPAVLWFDGEWEPWWTEADGKDLAAYVRSIAPTAVVNNRVGKRGSNDGDYETPEQEIPRTGFKDRPWETCMTTNGSWGYHKGDTAWKPASDILDMLTEIAGKGGNFLLNVGPTSEGLIPEECAKRLRGVGVSLAKSGHWLYGSTGFCATSWGGITRKGNTLYAVVRRPGEIELPVETTIKSVDGRTLGGKTLTVPAPTVLVIECDGEPRRTPTRAELSADGKPIPPETDGSYLLRATDAAIHGSTLRLEQQSAEGNAGYWTDEHDYLEWFVERSGDYEMELRYSVAPGAGGQFTISGIACSVATTGGWNKFKTLKLGRITISGLTPITVKPVRFTGALMNFASLRLTPVK